MKINILELLKKNHLTFKDGRYIFADMNGNVTGTGHSPSAAMDDMISNHRAENDKPQN